MQTFARSDAIGAFAWRSCAVTNITVSSALHIEATIFELFPMRSEPLQQQAAALALSQKGAFDLTIDLFLFPGPGDNIHHICVSCHAPTPSLLRCSDSK